MEKDVFIFPVSFAQQRLWFLDQLTPGNPVYNILAAVRLTGPLDVQVLAQAVNALVHRHEALRTSFTVVDDQPMQVVTSRLHIPLPVVDLRQYPAPERQMQAQQLAIAEARQPFDLSRGPLIRATALQLDEEWYHLLLTMHHSISDGWSMRIFFRELSAVYTAFATGQPSPLPVLPIQYADFAVWQRQWLQGDVLEQRLAYWKQRLAGTPPMLELPTDYPRPTVQTFQGAQQSCALSPPLCGALKALSHQAGATLFMTLLAAFQLLLSRYTGQDDMVVGVPVAGRPRPELEGVIGFFLNNVALRANLAGNPTFRELLWRVREVALDAYGHQELPFEKLVEELHPERDMSHTPLFQVFFNMLNFPDSPLQLAGVTAETLGVPTNGAKFDLTLYVEEIQAGIDLLLVYNPELFSHTRMVEMLAQYQHLLEQVVAAPDAHIARFSLVTPTVSARLPNPTQVLSDTWEGAVHACFAQQARRAPEQLAVVDPQETWTYSDLDAQCNQLANYLLAHGLQPEDVVAIYGHRSAAMVWAIMGVLRAGAVFLILDPAYPAARLLEYLDAAQPRAWLQIEAAGAVPPALQAYAATRSWCCRLLVPTRADAATRGVFSWYSTTDPEVAVGPDSVSHIAFTSGSTGTPKGIQGRHGPLSHFIPWVQQTFALQDTDRFAMLSGLAFDPLQRDIFTPLQLGATLCIPHPDDIVPGRLAAWLHQQAVSVVHLTPALGHILTEASPGMLLPSLRYAFFVGDVLTRQDVARLHQLAPQVTVVNYYGATETSRAVGYFVVPRTSAPEAGTPQVPTGVKERLPLGHGIQDVQLLVLNAAQQLAGIGEVGEIYLRSPHLVRGYLHDEARTQKQFLLNPWTQTPGDRLYRTGDLGRYLPDGTVEGLGRADTQVKVRGYRIELGEIEARLRQHPVVQEVAVLAREDVPGEKRLVAYVVPMQGTAPTAHEFRNFLKQLVPEYMVPAAFVLLGALPLTPNGKLDRQVLPTPDWALQEREETFVAPQTPMEELVAATWAKVLRREQIGIYDSFFEIGGHSLLATQVIARLRDTLQVEVPLRSLFETPTMADFARSLEDARRVTQGLQAPPLRPVSRQTALPLSFAQQRLWFLDQFEPNSAAYNLFTVRRLHGTLQVDTLRQALDALVTRHEALRTTFAVVHATPVQVVAEQWSVQVPVIDLTAEPETEREMQSQQLLQQEIHRTFDLSRDLMLRVLLLRLRAEEHILLLTMHHIASDGWSMGVLFRELAVLYDACSTGRASPLPALPIHYADFTVWQQQWLQGEVLATQLAYWQQQLTGAPPVLDLPTDRPRSALQTLHGSRQFVVLSPALSHALKTLSQQAGCTLFMTLLAAFQTLLYRYTGQEDIVIGTPIANRTRAELDGVIGFFVNTLVLRTDCAGNPTFRALLGRVREVCLGAYAHQDLPFEKLVEALQPVRDLRYPPLFQVMFALQNVPRDVFKLAGLTVSPVEIDPGTAKFDLTLFMFEEGEALRGVLEYNTALFEATTIHRFIGHFQTVLESIVANPEQTIATLPLLPATERQYLLREWNETPLAYPHEACIHELFVRQVERTPEAIALICDDQPLTYRELNQRANQLAHYLRASGVGPEVLVGICVERSLEMVIGLLGILKAGGAYVPLDPAYPQERLAFMVEDAQVAVLLTQQPLVEALPRATVPPMPHSHEREHTPLPIHCPPTIICLDTDWEVIARERTTNPTNWAAAEHPAYVIYTSGSTGIPKGVLGLHRATLNRLHWMWAAYPFAAEDVCCQKTSLNFVDAVWEIFGPLLQGIRTVILPDAVVKDARGLIHTLARHDVTRMVLVPSLLQVILDTATDLPRQLPCLKYWVTSGEALSVELCQRFQHCLPQRALINLYGSSEAAGDSTWYAIRDARELRSVPIGRPIANTQSYVLDAQLQPVPVGIPGELYIGGDGLARGYLNHPELTAERFLPNPFSILPGERLYKTGDLARYLPDGNLEFLGRRDHQVKIRGFRLELGEIAAVLAHHPAVRDAVVLAREDVPGDKRLIAYVVPQQTRDLAPDQLRAFLAEQLPAYMIPTTFIALDKLPQTPNGKLDRRALQAPHQSRPLREIALVAPRTPIEAELTQLWANLLGLEQLGIHENFFALGGHSLLAMRVTARMCDVFQIDLPLRTLFEAPTIAALATRIVQHQVTQMAPDVLRDLVAVVEGVSDMEAQQLLSGEAGSEAEAEPGKL